MSTTLAPPRRTDPTPAKAGKGLSPIRVASAIALCAWAFMFWFVLLTGRTSLYLSSRTAWVVPIAVVLLTAAAIGRLLSLRTHEPEPLHLREAWILGVMLTPVVVVLVMPPSTLSTFAAGHRSIVAAPSVSSADIASGDITLVDVASAQTSREGAKALSTRAGDDATFVGFVTPIPGNPAGAFLLTRYYITCCIADAQTIEVHVVDAPVGKFEADDWVRVTGKLYPLGRTVLMDAAAPSGSVTGIPKPSHPYITA